MEQGEFDLHKAGIHQRLVLCILHIREATEPQNGWFLAVQNSSIVDLVTHWVTDWLTHFYFCHTKSNPRDLRPLRHLISVMRRHDLTEKDLPNSKNLKIFRNSENCKKFWEFSKILRIFWYSENFSKISIFSKNLKIHNLQTLWNRNDFIDLPLACEERLWSCLASSFVLFWST